MDHPLRRLVGLTCLASGAILDAAFARFQGKGTDEKTLPRNLLDNLNADDILLGDAFYPHLFFALRTTAARCGWQVAGDDTLEPSAGIKVCPWKSCSCSLLEFDSLYGC
ncbi:MAG: hypothetical protein MH213_09400 [Marinobacter sp.]|nr:hypothetical protein [Marinobacter sp.]